MNNLNWDEFLTNLLKNNMKNRSNALYILHLNNDSIQTFLADKSDLFVGCFIEAYNQAYEDIMKGVEE